MKTCRACGHTMKNSIRLCRHCKQLADVYLPTPDEIATECESLREGWSADRLARNEDASWERSPQYSTREVFKTPRTRDNRD